MPQKKSPLTAEQRKARAKEATARWVEKIGGDRRAYYASRGRCTVCGARPPEANSRCCAYCKGKSRSKSKAFDADRKAKVFDHYGRVCVCCGESEPLFLTIDHVNGNGNKHRLTVPGAKKLYNWLVANGFPGGYRTLCLNCNIGRYRNGGVCPHSLTTKSRKRVAKATAQARKARGEVPAFMRAKKK